MYPLGLWSFSIHKAICEKKKKKKEHLVSAQMVVFVTLHVLQFLPNISQYIVEMCKGHIFVFAHVYTCPSIQP